MVGTEDTCDWRLSRSDSASSDTTLESSNEKDKFAIDVAVVFDKLGQFLADSIGVTRRELR